jgi:hypothetical protein
VGGLHGQIPCLVRIGLQIVEFFRCPFRSEQESLLERVELVRGVEFTQFL